MSGDKTSAPKKQRVKIGWATGSVTPDKPCAVAGQFHIRVARKVKDPVTATALAIESADGTQRAILMSLDAVGLAPDVRNEFDRKLAERLPDVAPEKVAISCTHTHTAPTQPRVFVYDEPGGDVMTMVDYGHFLAERLAAIAAEAWQKRASGAVAWGYGHAVVGLNRRATYMDRSTAMYGATNDPLFSHIEGHENHGVDLLFTYDPNRVLTGMIVNVACPSQCTEGESFVSADYWHETREELRRRFGHGVCVLGQCAAAGDQSPHLMLDRRAEERMFRLKGLLPEKGGDFNMAQRTEIARRIAAAVEDVLPIAAKDIRTEIEFAHQRSVLDVPLRRMTPNDIRTCHERIGFFESQLSALDQKKADRTGAEYSSNFGQARYYRQALERHQDITQGRLTTLPTEIHALRIGDVAFATNRFEYLLDFGDRIKARSPAGQTFVVQLTGEGSYLATERSERAGGYGAWFASTLLGADGGQMIVEESLRLIRSLFPVTP